MKLVEEVDLFDYCLFYSIFIPAIIFHKYQSRTDGLIKISGLIMFSNNSSYLKGIITAHFSELHNYQKLMSNHKFNQNFTLRGNFI